MSCCWVKSPPHTLTMVQRLLRRLHRWKDSTNWGRRTQQLFLPEKNLAEMRRYRHGGIAWEHSHGGFAYSFGQHHVFRVASLFLGFSGGPYGGSGRTNGVFPYEREGDGAGGQAFDFNLSFHLLQLRHCIRASIITSASQRAFLDGNFYSTRDHDGDGISHHLRQLPSVYLLSYTQLFVYHVFGLLQKGLRGCRRHVIYYSFIIFGELLDLYDDQGWGRALVIMRWNSRSDLIL